MLNEALQMAENDAGAHCLRERVDLVPHARARAGMLVRTPAEEIEPERVIVCAGSGTPAQLERLGLRHDLEVRTLAVLNATANAGVQAGLLIDYAAGGMSHGLVLARNSRTGAGAGRLTIRGRPLRALPGWQCEERQVTTEDARTLWGELPPEAAESLAQAAVMRFIAQHETAPAAGRPRIWIGRWDEYAAMRAVIPATMGLALLAAEQVLRELAKPRKWRGETVRPIGRRIPARRCCHHEALHDDLNEGPEWRRE